jgi:hypothetical protein
LTPAPPPEPEQKSNVDILDKIMAEADKEGVPMKKRKKRYKKDDGVELPKTTKPKARPKFGGSDVARGRGGPGLSLSQDEAKEKTMPKITVKRPSTAAAPVKRTVTTTASKPKESKPEKALPLEREPQPYGMDANDDPPMPLEREPQPYGMVAEEKPKKKAEPEPDPDPPKTRKPKAKPKFGGDDGGRRGSGRKLSKEEAKEKQMPKVYYDNVYLGCTRATTAAVIVLNVFTFIFVWLYCTPF